MNPKTPKENAQKLFYDFSTVTNDGHTLSKLAARIAASRAAGYVVKELKALSEEIAAGKGVLWELDAAIDYWDQTHTMLRNNRF